MKPELGEIVMTQHLDPETGVFTITVDHAGPRVLISGQWLDILAMLTTPGSEHFPAWQRNATLEPGNSPGQYGGCVLRIHATNQTLIYRITERHDEHAWIGEWPD